MQPFANFSVCPLSVLRIQTLQLPFHPPPVSTTTLTSAEGIDAETMECMYSPAKRRGPTPGIRSSAAATHSLILQQQQQSDIHAMTAAATAGSSDASTKSSTPTPTPSNPTQNTQNQAHTHPIDHPQSNSLSIHNNNTINSNSNSAALSNHGQQQQQQRQLHQQQQQQYPPAQQSMDPSMLMQHQQLHNAYYGQSTAEWSNTLHPFSQQQQQQQVALPHQQQHGQPVDTMDSLLLQQHQYQQNNNNNNLSQGGNTNFLGSSSVGNNSALNHHQQQQHSPLLQATSIGGGNRNSNNNNNAMMQTQLNQLTLLQQKIQQQHQQQQQQQQFQHFNLLNTMDTAPTSSSLAMAAASVTTLDPLSQQRNIEPMTFLSNQPNLVATPNPVADVAAATAAPFATLGAVGLPRTIMAHTHLIDRGDAEGSRLWAYYKLSVDEIFRLPSTPTDEEYCTVTGRPLVGSPLAALSAARFAESALGALAHNEIGLGMELCNAVVHCLKESLQDPLDFSVVFEVAKAYFLLGIGRAFRGDLVRYFKYRRVCLSYLSKLGLVRSL